jgi:hypothetical protein
VREVCLAERSSWSVSRNCGGGGHLNIFKSGSINRSRVSSGSIVSDYGLDDRPIGVRSR